MNEWDRILLEQAIESSYEWGDSQGAHELEEQLDAYDTYREDEEFAFIEY